MSPLLRRTLTAPKPAKSDRFEDDIVGLVVGFAFVLLVSGIVFDLANGIGLL